MTYSSFCLDYSADPNNHKVTSVAILTFCNMFLFHDFDLCQKITSLKENWDWEEKMQNKKGAKQP